MTDGRSGTIVIVEAQLSRSGIVWPEIAADLGYRTVFLSNDIDRYKKIPSFTDALCRDDVDIRVADTNSCDGILAAVAALTEPGDVRALFSHCDYNIVLVAEAAAKLGLPGLNTDSALKARNKLLARQAYLEYGVPAPDFEHALTPEEASWAAAKIGFPCVVKPLAAAGSVDVALCRTADDVLERFAVIAGKPLDIRGQPKPLGVLVEEYCQGYEVSVETVTFEGVTHVLGVIDKTLGSHPHFAETGHVFPSCLPSSITSELADVARAGLAATGHDFGAAHTEIRMTAAGPRLIEANGRLCGAELPDMIESATGIRLRHQVLAMHAGGSPCLDARYQRGAATRRFTAASSGVLRGIRGADEARAAFGVIDLSFEFRPGDTVKPAASSLDILGHVRTVASTQAEALRMADAASSHVTFVIE
jgi:S-sulfo-L-cysteine synthase (3-phospho-L-serine-dependent)